MRIPARAETLLLIGLVLAVGVLLLITDGAVERQPDTAEPPALIKWYPVSGGLTPEAVLSEVDWLVLEDDGEN